MLLFDHQQEIIKVRERIPHRGPLTKVIALKLFLDIVPSSSTDITRTLRGCRLISFQSKEKPPTLWERLL